MKRLQLPTRFLSLVHSLLLVLSLRSFFLEGLALGVSPGLPALWPLLPAYAAGSLLSGKKKGLFFLIPVCALSLLLLRLTLPSGGKPVLDGISAAALFLLGWKRREEVGTAFTFPMAALSAYTALRLYLRGESAQTVGLRTLLLLLAGLLLLHGQNLRAGLHNAPGETAMPWPKGVRGKNALLLLLFFSLVLGLASVPPLQHGAERLLRYTVTASVRLNADVRKLVRKPRTPRPAPSPTPAQATQRPREDDWTVPTSPVVWVFAVLAGIMGLLLLIALILLPGEIRKALRSRVRKRTGRRRRQAEEPELYEEEEEKLQDWKSLLRAARKRLRGGGRRPGRRTLRWRDLPDDRARVRFAWRQLRASSAGGKLSPALTPREMGKALGGEAYQALAEQYELARYAPGSALAPEAQEIAARALRTLRRPTKKPKRTGDGPRS